MDRFMALLLPLLSSWNSDTDVSFTYKERNSQIIKTKTKHTKTGSMRVYVQVSESVWEG